MRLSSSSRPLRPGASARRGAHRAPWTCRRRTCNAALADMLSDSTCRFCKFAPPAASADCLVVQLSGPATRLQPAVRASQHHRLHKHPHAPAILCALCRSCTSRSITVPWEPAAAAAPSVNLRPVHSPGGQPGAAASPHQPSIPELAGGAVEAAALPRLLPPPPPPRRPALALWPWRQ